MTTLIDDPIKSAKGGMGTGLSMEGEILARHMEFGLSFITLDKRIRNFHLNVQNILILFFSRIVGYFNRF